MSLLKKPFGEYTLFYRSEREIKGLIRDVHSGECDFISDSSKPLIIDAGAHIGVMTLWFKRQYPKARIICFEPNMSTFAVLKQNVMFNRLQNVTLVNAAISNKTGYTKLYGVMNTPDADTRGNSIVKNWGSRGSLTHSQRVKTEKLSDYIQEPIDFVKLDIEGEELNVLKELGQQIHCIKNLVVEVHVTKYSVNKLSIIKQLLNENGFAIYQSICRDLSQSLPAKWNIWTVNNHPLLTVLKTYNKLANQLDVKKVGQCC